jgi:hypothetical protein
MPGNAFAFHATHSSRIKIIFARSFLLLVRQTSRHINPRCFASPPSPFRSVAHQSLPRARARASVCHRVFPHSMTDRYRHHSPLALPEGLLSVKMDSRASSSPSYSLSSALPASPWPLISASDLRGHAVIPKANSRVPLLRARPIPFFTAGFCRV